MSAIQPRNFHVISPTAGCYLELLMLSVDSKQFKKPFAAKLIPNRVATIEFDLNDKKYDQIWIREYDGSWKAADLPFEINDDFFEKINKQYLK